LRRCTRRYGSQREPFHLIDRHFLSHPSARPHVSQFLARWWQFVALRQLRPRLADGRKGLRALVETSALSRVAPLHRQILQHRQIAVTVHRLSDLRLPEDLPGAARIASVKPYFSAMASSVSTKPRRGER
jgi:hypothetical protein